MSRYYNKDSLKEQLEIEQIYDLLDVWGGEPEYTTFGLISRTICHNPFGEGSRKLYYYSNTRLFRCFSGCVEPNFDIFELAIKVAKIQKQENWELYNAMDYIALYFGIEGESKQEEKETLADWEIFRRHKHKLEEPNISRPRLKEYNKIILSRFSYPHITPWEKEGIDYNTCRRNYIGYYATTAQITIPHFDIENRLIGIRGRTLVKDEAERYGKYRPLMVGNFQFNHPLSANLYNLNNSKDNISKNKTAIIFEGEKSVLKAQSFYGIENDIYVAACGSSISSAQMNLLKSCGIRELVIAFDRQFQDFNSEEFVRWQAKINHLCKKYGNSINISVIFDKNMITNYKDSPVDKGPVVFEKLLSARIKPKL